MKVFASFVAKELKAHYRGGRIFILLGIFALVGALNPITAKITPWLMDVLGDSLEASGMTIVLPEPTVLDSWVQFYSNVTVSLIAFLAIESDIFTKEYRFGTLVIALTKGLNRRTVLIAKTATLTLLWTVCYWVGYLATHLINLCFWDVTLAKYTIFAASCWWLFGLMVVCLMVFFSVLARSYIPVFLGSGAVALTIVLVGAIPKIGKYLPSNLLGGLSLVYGMTEPSDYVASILITLALCVTLFAVSIPIFNKKEM